MSNPYVGEIRMFAGNFAPSGWATCDGQVMAISQNTVLFTLIGTIYGGDGQQTFNLPDLRGRVPIHQGQGLGLSNYIIGQNGGVETVTLTTTQIPAHNHPPLASSGTGRSSNPANNVWAAQAGAKQFMGSGAINASMNATAMGNAGGSQPHDNMLPFLAINFIISLFGIFPSQ